MNDIHPPGPRAASGPDTAAAPPGFDTLLAAARRIASEVAGPRAAAVDRDARFPHEALAALREARLLSAGVPAAFGGSGCTLAQQGRLCSALGGACGATGMVLAMHFIQVACLARHADGAPALRGVLRDVVRHQWLLASITSEVGTGGDTRSSLCALQADAAAGRFRLVKEATTGSYCEHADALLVTCRRDADAATHDQRLVLVRRAGAALTVTGTWDTLGMRGTCSPPFHLEAEGPLDEVLPVPYADISAQTMVPWSHTLWSALWCGIAADAVGRAAAAVRAQARRMPGQMPPAARALTDATAELQALRHHWQAVADEVDALERGGPAARAALASMPWALRFNRLKVQASEAAPQLVLAALQIVGVPAYRNDGPVALGRHLRDALSAALMISNDRIRGASASMLMVLKEEDA